MWNDNIIDADILTNSMLVIYYVIFFFNNDPFYR